jgi:hypothetical protein
MTYLDLINRVLIRLREAQVATPTDTDYSKLVGYLVNDAKSIVEAAWDWAALRTTKTVTAVSGTNTYTITGSGGTYKFLDAYNSTSKFRLQLLSQNEMNTRINLNTAATSAPEYFSLNGFDSNGDQNIIVYPTPDATYSLKFDMVIREPELTASAQETALPTQPILLYAWAMATRERGETGGMAAQEIFGLADRALADAVALEASKYQAELLWRPV